MKKTDWIEEHNKEIDQYDKSILSRSEENSSMKDYEFSIANHDDESTYGSEGWYEPMGHFKD